MYKEFVYVQDEDQIFTVDKDTGEIAGKLTNENYKTPNQTSPDSATSLDELKHLCGDNTRTRRGDTGYLLDYMVRDGLSQTESKLTLLICNQVVVWNYAIVDEKNLENQLGLKSRRQFKNVLSKLQEKGIVSILNKKFETPNGWEWLVKVHPAIYWKGRASAHSLAVAKALRTDNCEMEIEFPLSDPEGT